MRPADLVVGAIAGAAGVTPTHAALAPAARSRSPTRNASSAPARRSCARRLQPGATILPVDSEHDACGRRSAAPMPKSVEKLIITASGGPFRTWTAEQIAAATPRAGAAPSQLVDGPEGHDRFGLA